MTYCYPPPIYDFLKERRSEVTPEGLFYAIWKIMGVTASQIKSRSRRREVVNARHIYCYVLKTETNMTLKAIGETLNGRDHTTVLNSVNKGRWYVEAEPEMAHYHRKIVSSLI